MLENRLIGVGGGRKPDNHKILIGAFGKARCMKVNIRRKYEE